MDMEIYVPDSQYLIEIRKCLPTAPVVPGLTNFIPV